VFQHLWSPPFRLGFSFSGSFGGLFNLGQGQLDHSRDHDRTAGPALGSALIVDDLRPAHPEPIRQLLLGQPKTLSKGSQFDASHSGSGDEPGRIEICGLSAHCSSPR
jgi:hypothetical protein